MHTHTDSINTHTNVATRFAESENVSRTAMSSREIADLVGSRHDSVKRAVERLAEKSVIGLPPLVEYLDSLGRKASEYMICKRDSFVVVAQLSPEFTAALVDRWQELEAQAAKPQQLTTIEILQIAMESEKARLLLAAQVEQQATKIHSLENLFKEGMTHTQFCKGLNGVNVMQVGKYLEARNWLYNESKSGLRFRVASYARDKYMTEHQHEITPHGKEPFVSFTAVLLKKGAVRLYDLYLAGELPMKKGWNGLYTHDKALRGAA
ncbi:Rha family transcriptional regulator [Pseudomonas chlororaphis subsp. piscium]